MARFIQHFVLILTLLLISLNSSTANALLRREWKVDGVTREALLHVPKLDQKTKYPPIVFAFHGHGGTMQHASRMFHIETLWPEAIVVYMQGLNTPGRLTNPEGKKPGWQRTLSDQGDRDLKFFDAVYATLKSDYSADTNCVYSMGHSNGGAFTYVLWQTRGHLFTAFAPSASLHRELLGDSSTASELLNALLGTPQSVPATTSAFAAKPLLHVAGENDPLVQYHWQKLFLEGLRLRNQCDQGKPWKEDKRCTFYKSKTGADVYTYIHTGTHKYPENAPEIIVKFFKAQIQR